MCQICAGASFCSLFVAVCVGSVSACLDMFRKVFGLLLVLSMAPVYFIVSIEKGFLVKSFDIAQFAE